MLEMLGRYVDSVRYRLELSLLFRGPSTGRERAAVPRRLNRSLCLWVVETGVAVDDVDAARRGTLGDIGHCRAGYSTRSMYSRCSLQYIFPVSKYSHQAIFIYSVRISVRAGTVVVVFSCCGRNSCQIYDSISFPAHRGLARAASNTAMFVCVPVYIWRPSCNDNAKMCINCDSSSSSSSMMQHHSSVICV